VTYIIFNKTCYCQKSLEEQDLNVMVHMTLFLCLPWMHMGEGRYTSIYS